MNKTLQEFNKKNLKQYCFSCDWLQLHVEHLPDWLELERHDLLIRFSGQSKVFKSIYEIVSVPFNKVIATYATDANECILGKNHGILKIDNKQLYINPDLKKYVMELLYKLKFKFIGITRLDLCYDFHSFKNARNPENFIKSYLRNDILKKGAIKAKFKTAGVELKNQKSYQYISFGARTSSVNYKLYNKTIEQDEVMRKPYIWEHWNKNSALDTNKTIWRLEFSMSSDTSTLLNSEKSFKYHSLDTLDFFNMYGIFLELYNHYFTFVFNDRNQIRKDRMKQVDLLDFESSDLRLNRRKELNQVQENSTRSTKIFLKHLNSLDNSLREFDENFSASAKDMITKLIDLYNLQDWAKNKGIDFDKSDYSENINQYIKLTK